MIYNHFYFFKDEVLFLFYAFCVSGVISCGVIGENRYQNSIHHRINFYKRVVFIVICKVIFIYNYNVVSNVKE